ncbi:MAG: histidine--tRNA ligase [Alphaproteobacteria bacterium]|nr:histidine--tRNA ligase [Alphaproteobacteria bacterium]
MSQEHKIHKPKPISGFPEWLPEYRAVELQWMDKIRKVFESYGFCSIETPSVEEIDALTAKGGETEKEIYTLHRLQAEIDSSHSPDFRTTDPRLALHFDLTVPLARYVAQHFNGLVFPFKRYQMQRVWRGERPQKGRFREFTQCDIDVINLDALPLHFDAEMPAIIWEVLKGLPGMETEKFLIRINNRKLLVGYLNAIGVTDENFLTDIMRAIDKKEKISPTDFSYLIVNACKKYSPRNDDAISDLIEKIKALINIKCSAPDELEEALEGLVFERNDLYEVGKKELVFVLSALAHAPPGEIIADLSIVRGLDYYTGTVYETVFLDNPDYGSICSGGRYDDLASQYINRKLPGVGISIGFSRLFAYLLEKGALPVGQKSPAHILMILPSEERRGKAAQTAQDLRERGYNVELYHAAKKVSDQLKYASRKSIPYVWFPPFEDGKPHEVKNMANGEQTQADPGKWEIPK